VGPPWGHKPCQQTCSGVGSSLHRSAGPGRNLLQHGLPMGSQPPSGIHLLQHGVPSMGYSWISAPPWTSMGCRGTTCLTTVFSTGCRGTSALVPGAPPPPSFFTDLGVCRVVSLTSSHSSIPAAVVQQPFPLLKYVMPEALPPSLMGSALASGGSILEPAGIGSIKHRRIFLQLLREATLVALLLPKPCHVNPVQ